MSAERSTESIIDLLYGELSEDEAREVREDLADSAELQGDLAEFESMLGRLREAMPVEEVSPSIHASIMDAARAGAQKVDEDRIIRRTAPEQGFWSRVGRGQGSQIALVAAVLIAGLFVVKAVERGSSPLHAPAANISSMEEAAPAMAASERPAIENEQQPAEALDEADPADKAAFGGGGAEGGEAIADQWSPEPEPVPEAPAKAQPPAPDVESSLRAELGRQASAEDSKREKAGGRAAEATPQRSASRSAKTKDRPAPRPSAAPTPSTLSKSDDSLLDALAMGDFDRDDNTSSPKKAAASSSAGADAPSGLVQGKSGLDLPMDAKPEPQAAEEKELQYRAPANSLSQVSERFRATDYTGTIRAADEFLTKNSSASDSDRASAMYFKAQSLEKQGKYTQADRIYQSIQQNYPTFESAQIDRARKEIQRKNVKKPSPKAKRKSVEVDSYAPESNSSLD